MNDGLIQGPGPDVNVRRVEDLGQTTESDQTENDELRGLDVDVRLLEDVSLTTVYDLSDEHPGRDDDVQPVVDVVPIVEHGVPDGAGLYGQDVGLRAVEDVRRKEDDDETMEDVLDLDRTENDVDLGLVEDNRNDVRRQTLANLRLKMKQGTINNFCVKQSPVGGTKPTDFGGEVLEGHGDDVQPVMDGVVHDVSNGTGLYGQGVVALAVEDVRRTESDVATTMVPSVRKEEDDDETVEDVFDRNQTKNDVDLGMLEDARNDV